jgi:hypothetical protein
MATGKRAKGKVVQQVRLKKEDVSFDSHGWMTIKNLAINRLIEQRGLASGLIQPINLVCPRPPGPPPSPDAMCACAYITIGQEVSQVRTEKLFPGELRPGDLRAGQPRARSLRAQRPGTVQTRGTRRAPEL